MAISYRGRPAIEADDVAALALVEIGSGSNMQGYYMCRGGANAIGKLSTLQESRATGYPDDMPVNNYDFQAPLGQYGQRRESYDALRVQHLFLRSFGSRLAPLPMEMPAQRPAGMNDRKTLRWSVRSDGQRGLLFVNNYQRIETLPDHDEVQFDVELNEETLKIPSQPIRIPPQSYFIWPFNMSIDGAPLRYATAQLLCQVGDTTVFFATEGIGPEFAFERHTIKPQVGALTSVPGAGDPGTKILLLS